MSVDQEMLKAYRKRWQAVVEIENLERQQASFSLRWQQVNSLLRMASALGLVSKSEELQAAEVLQRWNRLRSLHLAGRDCLP